MRVVEICVKDVNELVQTVFSGVLPPAIDDVVDEGGRIVVRADAAGHGAVSGVRGAVGADARLSPADCG